MIFIPKSCNLDIYGNSDLLGFLLPPHNPQYAVSLNISYSALLDNWHIFPLELEMSPCS